MYVIKDSISTDGLRAIQGSIVTACSNCNSVGFELSMEEANKPDVRCPVCIAETHADSIDPNWRIKRLESEIAQLRKDISILTRADKADGIALKPPSLGLGD